MKHNKEIAYPVIPAGEDVDYFHGMAVPDPYKWMEETESAEVQNWVEKQDALTDTYLVKDANYDALTKAFARMPGFVPDTLPVRRDQKTFFFAQRPGEKDTCLMMVEEENERIVLQPGYQGLHENLRIYKEFVYVSPGGRYIAFAAARDALDMQSIYIWGVDEQQQLDSPIPPTGNPVVAWLPDESGFFHNVTHLPGSGARSKDGIYLHRLGTGSHQDTLVFDYSEGDGHAAIPCIPDKSPFLFIKTINFVTQDAGLFYSDLADLAEFAPLFEDLETYVNITGVSDNFIFLETDWKSANSRILRVDLNNPQRKDWSEQVPEQQYPIARTTHAVNSALTCVSDDRLYVTYTVDIVHCIDVFQLDGEFIERISLPSFCSVNEISPLGDSDVEILASSFLTPYLHFRYYSRSGELTLETEISAGLDKDSFEVSQAFCQSYDGTRIPLFIIGPKTPSGSDNPPVLLYGYGGWGQATMPGFFPDLIGWLALGGTYVIANIRGGGEYGREWHEAGRLMRKQNVFDDFCSVAEYLIAEKIASAETLAVRGLSNGGLLMAACVNRKPELFAAAIAEIPLVDVVHLMDLPIGPAIAAELGDPTGERETFEYILQYSPLQNVRSCAQRPNMMVVVGTKDERALPAAAYKYVAVMQATAMPEQRILLRTVEGGGHTDWPWHVTTKVLIEELTFLLQAMCRE